MGIGEMNLGALWENVIINVAVFHLTAKTLYFHESLNAVTCITVLLEFDFVICLLAKKRYE